MRCCCRPAVLLPVALLDNCFYSPCAAWLLILLGWSSLSHYRSCLYFLCRYQAKISHYDMWCSSEIIVIQLFFVCTAVVQKFTFSSQKPRKSSEQWWFCHSAVSSVVYHTTDRPEPFTTDKPEGTWRHACPRAIWVPLTHQAILKFVRRNKRNNSHSRYREAYALDPVVCLTLHRFHTFCVIPYSL